MRGGLCAEPNRYPNNWAGVNIFSRFQGGQRIATLGRGETRISNEFQATIQPSAGTAVGEEIGVYTISVGVCT